MSRAGGGGGAGNQSAVHADLGLRAYAAIINTAGAHEVITPTAGRRIKIVWVCFIPNSDNLSSNMVQVGFEDAANPIYIGYALSKSAVFTGVVNKGVIVTTQTNEPVAVMVHYKEILA